MLHACRSSVFLAIGFLIITSLSCKTNSRQGPVKLGPFRFFLFSSINQAKQELSTADTVWDFEDSHKAVDKGVYYYYFENEYCKVDYYIRLFFLNHRLQGIKSTLYSKQLSANDFFKIVDSTIIKSANFSSLDKSIMIDTIRYNESPISGRFEYEIYVRTKRMNIYMPL